jgi:glycerol-3-phosphate acyltransferase PlsX
MAAREFGVEVILVGNEPAIRAVLDKEGPTKPALRIVDAPDVLRMDEKGEKLALKARHGEARNSMSVGIDLLKAGEADAFVTAGNTGAAMVTALLRLGRLRGVDRPALAPIFPTATGSCVVLDIGANPDCKPENLLQFGIMGSVYAQLVRGVENPKVGLVSIGEEEGKGNELVRAATPLFKASGLNYFGNVEGKEVIGGAVDVAVTDGFVGNVMLKTSEAVAKLIVEKIRESIRAAGPLAMVGGLLVQPPLRRVKRLLDPREHGAAILLGVNGLVLIGHGRSDATAIKNAIRLARDAVDRNMLSALRSAIEKSVQRVN